MRCSLHLVGPAFAIEDVSRLPAAFALAPGIPADEFANLVAADNLLLGRNSRVFHNFSHLEVSLGAIQVNRIECRFIITSRGRLGKTLIPRRPPSNS